MNTFRKIAVALALFGVIGGASLSLVPAAQAQVAGGAGFCTQVPDGGGWECD